MQHGLRKNINKRHRPRRRCVAAIKRNRGIGRAENCRTRDRSRDYNIDSSRIVLMILSRAICFIDRLNINGCKILYYNIITSKSLRTVSFSITFRFFRLGPRGRTVSTACHRWILVGLFPKTLPHPSPPLPSRNSSIFRCFSRQSAFSRLLFGSRIIFTPSRSPDLWSRGKHRRRRRRSVRCSAPGSMMSKRSESAVFSSPPRPRRWTPRAISHVFQLFI